MNVARLICVSVVMALISCGTIPFFAQDESSTAPRPVPAGGASIEALLKAGPSKSEPSADEKDLYRRIMEYRKSRSLPEIPLSTSLGFVAKLHVRDLQSHTFPASANFHSWSKDGPWSAVNYTPDHRFAKLMWDKPRELTKYTGNGYEIAFMSSGGATSSGALAGWRSSPLHNDVIINEGSWKSIRWQAIGIGIYANYAVAWFGEVPDPENGK